MKDFFCIDAEVFSVFRGFRGLVCPARVVKAGGRGREPEATIFTTTSLTSMIDATTKDISHE
jgi:hypothetical protein